MESKGDLSVVVDIVPDHVDHVEDSIHKEEACSEWVVLGSILVGHRCDVGDHCGLDRLGFLHRVRCDVG